MRDSFVTRDLCLGFWAETWARGVVDFPPGARVLEIGCAEADWMTPMRALRPDLHLTGIDIRRVDRPADVFIEGDVLAHEFPRSAFDAIVAVSAVEHIGLGAYGDPVAEDGDTRCMTRCLTWLAPGGWMYLDVPYRPPEDPRGWQLDPNYRGYDDAHLARLLVPGWATRWRQVWPADHPDGPYLSLVVGHA